MPYTFEGGGGGSGGVGGLDNLVEDTTPQLGGALDVNGSKIVSTSNGDIDIEPNGTGNVLLGNLEIDADQTIGAGQDNYVLTYDNSTGLISLEASAGGAPTAHAASHTDGTDDIQSATNAQKGLATAAHITAIEANTAKTSNATHTGEVVGATALTISKTAITGRSVVTADGADKILISDDSDAGNLKAALVSDLLGGGSMPPLDLQFTAGAFALPTTNPAPPDRDTGSNGFLYRQLFDDTTQEYAEGGFMVPADLDAAGTVTFKTVGYAVTAAASKNIQLSLEHSAKADGESWDAAYTAEDSGDLATDGTQDQLDVFSWTETVANLGWTAGDFVRFKISRKAPGSNNLSGDWGLNLLVISIPRA